MQSKTRILITVLSLLFPFCSCQGQNTSTLTDSVSETTTVQKSEKEEYEYEGEDYVMKKKSTIFGKEGYEEGKEVVKSTHKTITKWFENKGNHLYGQLSLPLDYDGKEKLPSVLLCHGFNSKVNEWDLFVPYFCQNGYAVFAFDFRGATEQRRYSDGLFKEMTLDTEKSDIKAALSYMESLPQVDKENLFLIGHSQGGLLVSLASADEEVKSKINALVTLSPAYSLVDDVNKNYTFDNLVDETKILYATVGKGYLYSALKYKDYTNIIKNYDGDVLMCHGDSDNVIKEASNQKARDAYGERLKYYTSKGTNHDFLEKDLETLMPEVLFPFLSAHQKGK